MRRSPGAGYLINRRRFVQGIAAVGMAASAGSVGFSAGSAQSMDPYTFIAAMDATTTVGQRVGEAASGVEPTPTTTGDAWSAYIQLPIKEGQDFHYTCEFDSAWILLQAYGVEMTLEEQLAHVGHDLTIEPYWEETPNKITVFGGDIAEMYSGDYRENILARARASAVRKVFDAVDLQVTVTPERASIEAALLAGHPVFFKSTVDFLDWRAATWVCPDGDEFPVVLTNDHALIVMGFNESDVIIRDPLGPTTTNTTRPWQYTVSWERYLQVIAAQGNDAIAIGPSRADTDGTGGAG